MKKFKLFFVAAFLLAATSAFISKADSSRLSQTGYNVDGNSCVNGPIDNTSLTCGTGTIQCQFTFNGVEVDAHSSCTPGTPPSLGQLLKHS